MDQVSRPLLIALLATVFVAAGWMAFMRPGAVESTTEEVTAPAQVATQAAEAAKATDAASAATEAAADAATVEPSATQAPSAPAAKTEASAAKATKAAALADADAKAKPEAKANRLDAQAEVLAQMDSGKVVVLLFWDRTGADDRAARDAAQDVDRRDGKVVVHLVDVRDVGRYDSVTQGVTVAQSPTTMVISPDGTARTIAGLSEPTEVDQLVRDALPRK